MHAAENSKPFDEIEFKKVLSKKFAQRDEEYDSMLGVVRETPPEFPLPDDIKDPKVSQKWYIEIRHKKKKNCCYVQIHGEGFILIPNKARHVDRIMAPF